MNDLFSLAGKNILITGSAQGIGFLLATGLGLSLIHISEPTRRS